MQEEHTTLESTSQPILPELPPPVPKFGRDIEGFALSGEGINSQGNRWFSFTSPQGDGFYYNNQNGSDFYYNPDATSLFDDGKGTWKITDPEGKVTVYSDER